MFAFTIATDIRILPLDDNLDNYIKQISEIPRDVILKEAPNAIVECYRRGYHRILYYLEKFSIHFNNSQCYECIHGLCREYYLTLAKEGPLNSNHYDEPSDIEELKDRNPGGYKAVKIGRGCIIYTTSTDRILSYLSIMTNVNAYICRKFLHAISSLNDSKYYNQLSYGSKFRNLVSGVLVDIVSVAFFTHRGFVSNIDLFLSMLFRSNIFGYIENIIVCTILKYNKRLVWNVLIAYIMRTKIKIRVDYLHISGVVQNDRTADVIKFYASYTNASKIQWRDQVIRICSNLINELTYNDILEFECNDKLVTMFIGAFMRTYHRAPFVGAIIQQLLKKGLSLDVKGSGTRSLREVLMENLYHCNKKIHNAIMAFG